jgi:hypothetical protein
VLKDQLTGNTHHKKEDYKKHILRLRPSSIRLINHWRRPVKEERQEKDPAIIIA